MHFSIPCNRELKDESGTSYTGFDVHVNGVLHCTVRYRQLFDLNEKLKQEFGTNDIPVFPPKKLFAVKGAELFERKRQLEKYLQELCQVQSITNCETFATFWSKAQQETQLEESAPVYFDVYLLNGAKININIRNVDQTDVILENAMAALGIKEELTYYFGLFLVKSKPDGDYSLVRRLQDFECPYLSLKTIDNSDSYKIVVRKAYWDQCFDEEVLTNNIGLNLLQVQAESDVKIGWTECNDEERQRLKALKSKRSKREYVQFCQTLPYYGHIRLDPCSTNYPQENTQVVISIGNFGFIFKPITKEKNVTSKHFLVTKIKSWKVSSLFPKQSDQSPHGLLLSFEYLVSSQNLQWIEVKSDQAIIMSMSIKSMVDELLRKKGGGKIKRPSDRCAPGMKPSFKPRDKTTEALFDLSELDISGAGRESSIKKAKDSVKKISGILPSAKSSEPLREQRKTEAEAKPERAFENIGDDDL